ncbi:MAG: hypothetical protein QM811_00590 [Pirellulales bacterium]
MLTNFGRRCVLALTATTMLTLGAVARDPVKIAIPATADGTVKTIAASVADGKFEVLWQALPASYQKDVEKILDEFSENMDEDVWNKGSKLAEKVSKVLTTKQDFIVANPIIGQVVAQGKMKPEDLKVVLTEVGGLLGDLQSHAKTLDDVGDLDIEEVLATLGTRAKTFDVLAEKLAPSPDLQKGMKALKDVKVKLVSSTSDTAVLDVTDPEGKVKTEEYVNVEGKWLPKKMSEEWKKSMADALKKVEALDISAEDKQKALLGAGMVEGIVDSILNAKTQQEFDAVVLQIIPLLQGGGAR